MGDVMISREDLFSWLAYTGLLLMLAGAVGLIIQYRPQHLIYIGVLMFFAGFYFYHAEVESKKHESDANGP